MSEEEGRGCQGGSKLPFLGPGPKAPKLTQSRNYFSCTYRGLIKYRCVITVCPFQPNLKTSQQQSHMSVLSAIVSAKCSRPSPYRVILDHSMCLNTEWCPFSPMCAFFSPQYALSIPLCALFIVARPPVLLTFRNT